MKLISNATVYKAEIPVDVATLHNHLAEHSFEPPGQLQARSAGFVPVHEDRCDLVETFPGGIAFRLRIDDKVIPGSVLRARHAQKIKAVEQTTGRKPGKKERAQLKDDALLELLAVALVKTTASITCYYHAASGLLIVPTTSKAIADICVSKLIMAVGSVKTETLHVSDVKHGLTTRLKAWLDEVEGIDAFGSFQPRDQVTLKADKRSVSVRMSNLESARKGLTEALAQGFTVSQLGLAAHGYDLRLTADFKLRSLEHHGEPEKIDGEEWWPIAAELQVGNVVSAVTELLRILAYKKPDEQAEPVTEVTQ